MRRRRDSNRLAAVINLSGPRITPALSAPADKPAVCAFLFPKPATRGDPARIDTSTSWTTPPAPADRPETADAQSACPSRRFLRVCIAVVDQPLMQVAHTGARSQSGAHRSFGSRGRFQNATLRVGPTSMIGVKRAERQPSAANFLFHQLLVVTTDVRTPIWITHHRRALHRDDRSAQSFLRAADVAAPETPSKANCPCKPRAASGRNRCRDTSSRPHRPPSRTSPDTRCDSRESCGRRRLCKDRFSGMSSSARSSLNPATPSFSSFATPSCQYAFARPDW